MRINKKTKILLILLAMFPAFFWSGIEFNRKLEWKIAENLIAAGAFPYEVGCSNAVIIPCFTTPTTPPLCTGGTLCNTIDAARCLLYSDVTGMPAGQKPCNVLFMKAFMAQAGLTPGASFIAAGTGPTLMDQGPLASWGGCVNCYAQHESKWKQKLAAAKKMFVAVFKD